MQLVENLSGNNTKNIIIHDIETDEISRSRSNSKNTNPNTNVAANVGPVSGSIGGLRYTGGKARRCSISGGAGGLAP